MTFHSAIKILSISLFTLPLGATVADAWQDAEPQRGAAGLARHLGDQQVHRELQLTEKQLEDLKPIVSEIAEISGEKGLRQAEARLSAVLTAKQFKQLKRIHWRTLDGYALLEKEVAALLGLTQEQLGKLGEAKATNTAEHKKMLDFMRRARFRSREAMEQFKAKYRTAANQRLRAVLTPKQAVAFRALLDGGQVSKTTAGRDDVIRELVEFVKKKSYYALRDAEEKEAIAKLQTLSENAAPAIAALLAEGHKNREKGWIQVYRPMYILQGMGEDAKVAMPDIIKALEDEHAINVTMAAHVLGAIGPEAKDAVPALLRHLDSPNHTAATKKRLTQALQKIDAK